GLVNPALRAWPEHVSLCAYVRDVRIGWIDAHSRDLTRISEADGSPRLSAIAGAPDAITVRYVATYRVFASTDVDDVGIRFADANRADSAAEVLVSHWGPRDSAIGGLEAASTDRPLVILIRE